MQKVKGVYDGSKIDLLEPVSIPPNTTVEVLIPETESDKEKDYWNRLRDMGLISGMRSTPDRNGERHFEPIVVSGQPLSETILEERR